MIRLLADHNVEQHVNLIWGVFDAEDWARFHIFGIATFAQFGLTTSASDRAIWETCQSQSLFLVTGNRNAKGDDSLTKVIAESNKADSLPVLTIGRVRRIRDFRYREDCAYRIADISIQLDDLRGAGRLFIP